MPEPTLITLTAADADRIVELERRSFIPCLQATTETVLKRFRLGHYMFGLEHEGRLVGMVSFCYGHFDPSERESFPKTVKELCLQVVPKEYNAVYIYNLEVEPEHRGRRNATLFIRAAMKKAKEDGCIQAVANARIPSYAGSRPEDRQENISLQPALKAAIDRHLAGGPFPTTDELLLDPLLSLYHHVSGCEFIWIIPDMAPEDIATGGIRVIAWLDMAEWSPQDASQQ